jgi:hypothetical protein
MTMFLTIAALIAALLLLLIPRPTALRLQTIGKQMKFAVDLGLGNQLAEYIAKHLQSRAPRDWRDNSAYSTTTDAEPSPKPLFKSCSTWLRQKPGYSSINRKGKMMNTHNLNNRFRATGLAALIAVAAMGATTGIVHAGGIERIDIAKEGIDLSQVEVRGDSSGYTGTVTDRVKLYLRAYAKTKGGNRIWEARIVSKTSLYLQNVGKSEGWAVYAKSHVFNPKVGSVDWIRTPKTACDALLKEKVRGGMSKQDVLRRDWKTSTAIEVTFGVSADNKANNKKGKHNGVGKDYRYAVHPYRVNVLCRAAL